MIFNRRFKKRRHHRELRHHRPVVPTAFQRSDVLRGLPQFLHQPRLCGERLLEPLLQIHGIVSSDVPPLIQGLLFLEPSVFTEPTARRDKDEDDSLPFGFGMLFEALFEIFIRFLTDFLVVPNSQPDFPSGIHGVPTFVSTQPSHPGRWESSLPGKSTVRKAVPVE